MTSTNRMHYHARTKDGPVPDIAHMPWHNYRAMHFRPKGRSVTIWDMRHRHEGFRIESHTSHYCSEQWAGLDLLAAQCVFNYLWSTEP